MYVNRFMVNYNWQEQTDTNSDPLSPWADTSCLLKCCGTSHGLCTESLIKCCSMWIAEMPVTLEQGGRKECALNKNTERSSGLYFLIFPKLVKSWLPLYFTKVWTGTIIEDCTGCPSSHMDTEWNPSCRKELEKDLIRR